MQTRRLGSQGPQLSAIGFGAWEAGGTDWGPNDSDASVIDAIHAALEAGIDWIDTAEVYGDGESERLVGLAVAGRRDEVAIASKVAPDEGGSGFLPEQIAAACDASLARLGIEAIDLYQLHWPDASGVAVEDSWGAMAELAEAGKVRYVGVSNFDRGLIERCEAVRHVDSLQQEFSMLVPDDRELIAWCAEVGTGVVSYSPLAVGMLTGAYAGEVTFPPGDWRASVEEGPFAAANIGRSLRLVDGMRPIAARLGVTCAQLALAWNIHQPGVTSAIAGSRSAAHMRSNAAAADVVLDAATLDELEALLR